jgi:NtrC-family two-component system response regulator AlgB
MDGDADEVNAYEASYTPTRRGLAGGRSAFLNQAQRRTTRVEQCSALVGRALKAGSKRYERRILPDPIEDSPLLQSRSPVMLRLLENARMAASSNATILITGEGGTGKSLLARQIHLWSPRRTQPFSVIDCTRLSQQQDGFALDAQSSLTASVEALVAGAAGGTVFLARVDELHPALQGGLARLVQERTIHTVEGKKKIEMRIIASSNRDLVPEVKAHRFREDLFYSLNIISLYVPPVCERPTDILPLAAGMLAAAAIRNHRSNLRLSAEAAAAMTLYRWPGNVLELRNAMEAAAVLCERETVALETLPETISKNVWGIMRPPLSVTSLEEMERQHILRVLEESTTLEQAAATLGINVATLWRKRKRYNLDLTTGGRFKRSVPYRDCRQRAR